MEIKILENEYWWGCASHFRAPQKFPFSGKDEFSFDLRVNTSNQSAPILISSKGRVIKSDKPFAFTVKDGIINITFGETELLNMGSCLKEAYLSAAEKYFPFEKRTIPDEFFSIPQYNTWMQFNYEPTAEGVLKYAHDIIDNGFQPGILMIDEGWHTRYGIWEFDKAKFPDPKKTIEELHSLGFKVMLWVVPYVTPDGKYFATSLNKDFDPVNYNKRYVKNKDGQIMYFAWWNGYSALLNLLEETDNSEFNKKLKFLVDEYKIDGFKFDGANACTLRERNQRNGLSSDSFDSHKYSEAYNELGKKYKYHEFKDTYNMSGKSIAERLCDRDHTWEGEGLSSLIPMALRAGLLGYPYICPDMVGGGNWTVKVNIEKLDQELFVRMAQASALFPMMQFSWAPWEALDKEHFALVKKAADLHASMADTFLKLADHASLSGEPIMRTLEYYDPHKGYAEIDDEFMLGNDILVAPVMKKSAKSRNVVFPKGSWQDQNTGKIYKGNSSAEVSADISVLPWFKKV